MPTDLNTNITITGADENGSIPEISAVIKALQLGLHEIIKVKVPASGPPVVYTMPGGIVDQELFFLKTDLPVTVVLNAEAPLTPGGGGTLPGVILRTGGPNITTVTITPNGTAPANVLMLVAGN